MAGSDTYGKRSTPTTPQMKRAVLECDDDVPTMVRCPTCLGAGCITAEQYAAIEADAKRREEEK